MNLFRKCLAEMIGVFAIVFIGCGAIIVNQIGDGVVGHLGIAISFGLAVMTMIYALGHISGAHFNPAVTIAFSLTRHFPKVQIIPYILAQACGAILASSLHVFTLNQLGLSGIDLGSTLPLQNIVMIGVVWEIILTAFLMFVIMAVATDYRAVGQAAGLAIGATVVMDALVGGIFSGASMNPARSLGPMLLSDQMHHFWIYIVGPVIGAIVGAIFYNIVRCEATDKKEVSGCC